MRKYILFTLFLSISMSQQLIPSVETYDNGNIKRIKYHKKKQNRIEQIKEERYYMNGQKKEEVTIKDGKPHGRGTRWYENGQKKEEGTFKDGKPDGLQTKWYENGKIKEQITFNQNYTQYEEAAEDAIISAIKAGLESYATEKLMENGRRSWPTNPWDALENKPEGFTWHNGNATDISPWSYNSYTNKITHIRRDGTLVHWDYDKGTNTGGNSDVIGSLGARELETGN